MGLIVRLLIVSIFLFGYVFNMYYLTVDDNIRRYQWINKIGIIFIPLGGVMGYVYIVDKKFEIKENK